MKVAYLVVTTALVLSGCATNPAEDPVQIKLNDVDARLGSVERVVSNQSLVDMSRRLDALEAQLRAQHGHVEVLEKGGETARKAQRDLYSDLDKRLAALESGQRAAATAVGAPGTGASSAAADVATGDDQAAYNGAFEKLKAGSYGDAIVGFQELMERYPASALLDNAQYWIGEAYYVTRDYGQAAAAFRAVGDRWPASRKAPDALLKLGYTQFEQKHLTEARATLRQVVERFPDSDAARLAQERLQKLPAEGH